MEPFVPLIAPFVCLYLLIAGAVFLACFGGRGALFTACVALVLVTNIALAKQIDLAGVIVPLGILPFSFLYVMNDLAVEDHNARQAYLIAFGTTISQVAFTAFVFITLWFPVVADDQAQGAIEQLFGITPRVTLAGVLATLGSFTNVWVFAALRRHAGKGRRAPSDGAMKDGAIFLHGTIAAAVGEFVNTAIFLTVAFSGILPDLWNAIMVAWIVKVIIGTSAMPILVIGRRILDRAPSAARVALA